jgi:hypothetical protein
MSNSLLSLYEVKVAVCSEVRTQHIRAMLVQCTIFGMSNLVVHKVIARLSKVNIVLHSKQLLPYQIFDFQS